MNLNAPFIELLKKITLKKIKTIKFKKKLKLKQKLKTKDKNWKIKNLVINN